MKLRLRARPVNGLVLVRVEELPDLYAVGHTQQAAERELLGRVAAHIRSRRQQPPPSPTDRTSGRSAADACLPCGEGEHDCCLGKCSCRSSYHALA